MKGQSKRHSVLEAALNVISGVFIAFAIAQLAHVFEPEIKKYIWSGFVWDISPGSNAMVTLTLTIVSVIRGYIWRRAFNKIQLRKYSK